LTEALRTAAWTIRERISGTQPSPWRTQTQLAIVAYVGWHNHDRLHEALGDLPPAEYETRALTDALRG
jgi:transposase InsO family protein